MIPRFYRCKDCGKHGVKLWRQYQTFAEHIRLLCVDCAEFNQNRKIDLSDHDQCGWLVPAVPTFEKNAPYWGYTSVPPEGVAWWKALPLRLFGEWKVKGGREVWMDYREGINLHLEGRVELRRCDMSSHSALVFIPDKARKAVPV